jgi:hypothetical protein
MTKSHSILLRLAVIVGALSGMLPTTHAALVVVPNSRALIEGNSNNCFPFDIQGAGCPAGVTSMHYQQIYGSATFPVGAVLISQIAFRPDGSVAGTAFSSTLPNIRIDLSTTSVAPGALSSTFASNVGADDQIVFSGPLSLSSANTGPATGPKAFDIIIDITPFLFDPGLGNLLLDVRNFGGGATTFFDAHNEVGDGVARAFARDVNSPTATDADSIGLVTRFTTSPVGAAVAEPASLALLAFALLAFGAVRARKK